MSLATCAWLVEHHHLIITGPTGIGKSFLACAFVERACRRRFNAYYVRAPRLIHDLPSLVSMALTPRVLTRLARLDLLAIDDWLISPLKDTERRDLMEVIEERAERGSTLISCQLPTKEWHASIGDPNHADALCDRLLHNAHRIVLKGRTMRNIESPPKNTITNPPIIMRPDPDSVNCYLVHSTSRMRRSSQCANMAPTGSSGMCVSNSLANQTRFTGIESRFMRERNHIELNNH